MKAIPSMAVALLLGLSGNTFAAYTVHLLESGGNVVANGSGSLNLTALTPAGSGPLSAGVVPSPGLIFVGGPALVNASMGLSGPPSFGSGLGRGADAASGDMVGLDSFAPGFVFTPLGYVSGSPLSSSATWNSASLASLGLTPGTHTWNWGSGPTADSFTVQIGAAPAASVPTLSSGGMLILCGLMAGWATRQRRARH